MKFTDAGLVSSLLWDMRLADQPRGTNRARINRLFDGLPPWSSAEQEAAQIKTNVNFLEGAKLAADARRSYYQAFFRPDKYFTVTLDFGPVWQRDGWGRIITREINRTLKESLAYTELLKSQFAMVVLHGIGPAVWTDRYRWLPRAMEISDVMIPSNTLLTLENLSHFGVFRRYTPMELYRLTHGPKVDPAWNMPVVKAALAWADEQVRGQLTYAETWAPEKVEQRWKEDLGFMGTDSVPTVDVWDFYYWSDEKKHAGWRRKMILDTPSSSEAGVMPRQNKIGRDNNEWLYDAGKRVFADNLSQIVHFQFGDCSAVAPFRYHSVRSLGWLLFAVCHIQNRLRCKFNDAVFESLLQYFRVSNPEDHERLTKLDLQNFGVVPEGTAFVKRDERWSVDHALVSGGLSENKAMMNESAAQFREGRDLAGRAEKTATQIMAEVNSANALVGSMLMLAYQYEEGQYREICRRFCVKESRDPSVRETRARILRAGVPPEALECSMWHISAERVIGGGNKILEVAMMDKIMSIRPVLHPPAQREVDRRFIAANTDDWDLALRLVPDEPFVSDSVHDAQLTLGTLMQGLNVTPKPGVNYRDVIETMLGGLAKMLQQTEASGGMAPPDRLAGMQNVALYTAANIKLLSQDKTEKMRVRQYGDDLKKIMNILKGYGQRLAEQAQAAAQGGGNGGIPPENLAKIEEERLKGQMKRETMQLSHAQRLQQRQEQHEADMQKKLREEQVAIAAEDLRTAAEIRRQSETPPEQPEQGGA